MLVSGSQEDLCEEEAAAGVSGGDQARVQVQGHRVILLLYIHTFAQSSSN